MNGTSDYSAQGSKLDNLQQKIQEVVNRPFTQRRMEQNIETDEQIEFQVALSQIMEYENMLMECSQSIQYMKDTIKEEFEKKETLHDEQIIEKQNEIAFYIRRCDELQDQNNELAQKNCTIVNNLEDLEDELNRQKEVQRKLEFEISQLNDTFHENKVQIRERSYTVQQLQEENQQQTQKSQQVLLKQKTEIFDLQERYNSLLEQIAVQEKQYQDSLKEIEGLKKGNAQLKEINENLKVEIIKILDEKELLYDSDDHCKTGNHQHSKHYDDFEDHETILNNHQYQSDKKQQNSNHQNGENSKNQFETIYGDLMSDYNKNQFNDHFPKSARHHHYYNSHHQNSQGGDSNKFQSHESNQLSQLKKDESFFEGFNAQTHRSTDSQMSMNFISNFYKETNVQNEQHNQISQSVISSSNMQDHENIDKVIASQRNSKSPQLSVRSSFESPRINQLNGYQINQNKPNHGKEVIQERTDQFQKKQKNCQEQETNTNDTETHQNEVKLDKYQKQSNKHQRYLSAIPTSKSNSFEESLDDLQDLQDQQEENLLDKKQQLSMIPEKDSQRNEVIIKIDIETQTNQEEQIQIKRLEAETQTQTIQQEIQNQPPQNKQEEQKEIICTKCKNKEQEQQNEVIKEVKIQMPCVKCKNIIQDPYHIFYILTCQTAKLNSKFRDEVIDFDVKYYYQEVKENVPLNEVILI